MKKHTNEPVEIDEADVPMQVRRDAGMFGPDGDDFGPKYIIAGGKAYRRRQGIWQGKGDYKPSAPGQWYIEDAPEDGLAKGRPGLEEPAPVKVTEQSAKEKSKAAANEKAAVAEQDDEPKRGPKGPDSEVLSAADAKDQAKAQAASNKLAPKK